MLTSFWGDGSILHLTECLPRPVEVAGALPAAELLSYLARIGMQDVRLEARFDCFRATSKEKTAVQLGVRGANVFARKPIQ